MNVPMSVVGAVLLLMHGEALCLAQSQRIPVADQPPHASALSIQKLLNEAAQATREHDYSTAISRIEDANKGIKLLDSDDKEALSSLTADAKLHEAQLVLSNPTAEHTLQNSCDLFLQVADSKELGNARQKAVARVGAGAALMQLGKPERAVELMEKCDWDQFGPDQQHILYYNYGRALEESGKTDQAILRYSRSLRLDSTFEPAQARLQAAALQVSGRDPKAVFATGIRLIELSVPRQAAKYAIGLIREENPESPLAISALRVLLFAWSQTVATNEQFETDLVMAKKILVQEQWKPLLAEVDLAVHGKLPAAEFLALGPGSERLPQFPWLCNESRKTVLFAFADFLSATADRFLQHKESPPVGAVDDLPREQVAQAFARVYGAWTLKPTNLKLARRVTWIVHDHGSQMDPESGAVNRFVDALFGEKSELLVKAKTENDWREMLQLHTYLGLIFESKGNWGDENTVRSAVGQWSQTTKDESEIKNRVEGRGFSAPGAHEHLALCLAMGKLDLHKAFDEYAEAAQGYLKSGHTSIANDMVKSAGVLGIQPTDSQRTRLLMLTAAIADALKSEK